LSIPQAYIVRRILVGTTEGFVVFSVEPFAQLAKLDVGPCALVAMLGETSLVFTVGSGETPSSDSRMLRVPLVAF